MTKKAAAAFLRWLANGGIWVIAEPAEAVKRKVRELFPDHYDEHIQQYLTPQKYLLSGEHILVVSLTDQGWGGVMQFPHSEVSVDSDEAGLVVIKSPDDVEVLVSVRDFRREVGTTELITPRGTKVTSPTYEVDTQAFHNALVETGLVTAEEIARYENMNSWSALVKVRVDKK